MPLNDLHLFLIQGHHNQDRETDGRAGGHWHRHSGLATLQTEDYEPLSTGE